MTFKQQQKSTVSKAKQSRYKEMEVSMWQVTQVRNKEK